MRQWQLGGSLTYLHFSLREFATSSQRVPFQVEGRVPKKPVNILLQDGSAVNGINQNLGLLIVRFDVDAQDRFPLCSDLTSVSAV